jgi:hypothetical protein
MTATEVAAGGGTEIREFHIGFAEAELTELRRRISATRWPEQETVDDDSQGVPLATMQELARYWATHYDWSRCEARLNGLPNFLTEIDGLDITSSTSARSMPTRSRSSSRTVGPARSSSS